MHQEVYRKSRDRSLRWLPRSAKAGEKEAILLQCFVLSYECSERAAHHSRCYGSSSLEASNGRTCAIKQQQM